MYYCQLLNEHLFSEKFPNVLKFLPFFILIICHYAIFGFLLQGEILH